MKELLENGVLTFLYQVGRAPVFCTAGFRTNEQIRDMVEVIRNMAKSSKSGQAVLIGGEKPWESQRFTLERENEKQCALREALAFYDIDLVLIDPTNDAEELIKQHLGIDYAIGFSSAKEINALRLQTEILRAAAAKVGRIRQRIERDLELLEEYPVVCKVEEIFWEPRHKDALFAAPPLGEDFCELLQMPSRIISPSKAVFLYGHDKFGYLMTRSKALGVRIENPCNLPSGFFTQEERGLKSLRMHVSETSGRFEISFYAGKWQVKAHGDIDPADPKYLPLADRLARKKR